LGPRYIRVAKRGKEPIDRGWTNAERLMHAEDPRLRAWLAKGGNYGVVGGWGLVILDADTDEVKRLVSEKLPATFTVESPGSRGWHCYYLCGLEKPIRLRDRDGENIGDVQGQGKMVVGPGSIHPNGLPYRILADRPLAMVTKGQLAETLRDYVIPEQEILRTEALSRNERQKSKLGLDITQVIPLAGMREQGDEYYGSHPIHGSHTGRNFWVNPSKNAWHCFRHSSGGGPLSWLAVEAGIIRCEEASGALTKEVLKQALEEAEKRGLLDVADPIERRRLKEIEQKAASAGRISRVDLKALWQIGRSAYGAKARALLNQVTTGKIKVE